MSFMGNIKNEIDSKIVKTTNGANAYETSGKALLDFHFGLTGFRGNSENQVAQTYEKAYFENPIFAIKYLFYCGDVRGGVGERRIFNICFKWLVENKPEKAIKLIKFIPEYTRWDNLVKLIDNKEVKDEVVSIIKNQLVEDMENMREGKPVSLLAKWLPSENTSSKVTKKLAKEVRAELKLSPRNYRKALSCLRRHLDVVETKMSAKEWNKINYETVPSKANLKYKNAFLRNDEERRKSYLESLMSGEAKINASVTFPDEIVAKYTRNARWSYYNFEIAKLDYALEGMWEALPSFETGNTLVVRDGSGSMYGKPMDVATALAIYFAEHNTGEYKNKFITFSRNPKFVDLSNCETLKDKINRTMEETEVQNTDIYKTMKLILKSAVENKVSMEEMPNRIIIISDMQFDGCVQHANETIFRKIENEYRSNGYNLPKIIFWNVSGRVNNTIPMKENELGVILTSGYSTNLINMVMSDETDPYKALIKELSKPRYDAIEKALV